MSSPSALIVGSGLSGLFTALALLKNGLSVRIIDKASAFNVGQKGSGVQPRTIDIHEIMGTFPEFSKVAAPMPLMNVYSPPEGIEISKTVSLAKDTAATSACPNPLILRLGQAQHEELMRSELAKFGVRVELNTELVSFEQDADSVHAVISKYGQTPENVEFKWLVGADGAHSTVRHQLGINFLGETREDERLLVGDVKSVEGLDTKFGHCWVHKDTTFLLLPSFRKAFTILVNGRSLMDNFPLMASSRAELVKNFHEISGRKELEFGELIWTGIWRANIRMVDKFGVGRVYIVGDAAHAHSPTGGQGFNSGIQDAINLSWKLALVHKSLASPTLLDSYTSERLPVISAMLQKTTKLFNSELTRMSENVLKMKSGVMPGRGEELNQLGITYRGSRIVRDDRDPTEVVDFYRSGMDGKVYAGDRAPDASAVVAENAESKVRLFKIFGIAYHTIIIFPSAGGMVLDSAGIPVQTVRILEDTEEVAESKSYDYILIDSEKQIMENYNAKGYSVVIVRPDGVVGAKVSTAEDVKAYFGGIVGTR